MKSGKAYGYVCPVCGCQISDGELIVDTEDGMAHEHCCNRGSSFSEDEDVAKAVTVLQKKGFTVALSRTGKNLKERE